jgi:hypothetical protein
MGGLGLMRISHHVYISNLFSVGIGRFTGISRWARWPIQTDVF